MHRRYLIPALFSIWALLFVFLATHVYISDSEIWSINLGVHFFEDLSRPWVYTRPLFHFLLWLVSFPWTANHEIFMASRFLFGLIGVLIVWLVWKISKRSFASTPTALIAACIVALNPTFLHQGFRVRSDILAALIALFVLYWSPRLAASYRPFGYFLTLLATPKGLIFSTLGWIASEFSKVVQDRKSLIKISIYLLTAVVFVLFFEWNYILQNIREMAPQSAFDYLQKSSNVYALFRLAPWFGILILARLILPAKNPEEIKWKFVLFPVLFFWAVFPSRTPFFIAATLPFAAISVAPVCRQLLELIKEQWLKRTLKFLLPLYVIAQGIFFIQHNWAHNSNDLQFQTLSALESYFSRFNHPLVYDVIGLNPRSDKIRYFLGPHQSDTNARVASHLALNQPEFILRVNKLLFGGDPLIQFLSDDYVYLGFGVYGRKLHIDLRLTPSGLTRFFIDTAKKYPWLKMEDRIAAEILRLPIGKRHQAGVREIITPTLSELIETIGKQSTTDRGWILLKVTFYPPITLPMDLVNVFHLDLQPVELFGSPNLTNNTSAF